MSAPMASGRDGLPALRVLYALEGSAFGGVERQVQILFDHLDRDRVEPAVIGVVPEQLLEWLRERSVPVEQLDPVRGKFDVRSWRQLPGRIARLRPDILHVVQSQPFASQYVTAAALLLGVPVVSTVHFFSPPSNRRQALLQRPLLHRVDVQVMASRFLRDQLAGVRGLAARVEMIDNGVEAPRSVPRDAARARLGLPLDAVVVGGAMRLVPEKRVDAIVGAARRLRAHVLVIGEGPERTGLAGLGADVHLPGFRPDAADLLQALDVYLQPCEIENQPLAIVEAMHQGVPVVVADTGGGAEIVEREQTGLHAPAEPESMAAAVRRLLDDDALRQRLVGAASDVARTRFAPGTMADRHHRLYDRVMARRGRWGDRSRGLFTRGHSL